MCDLRRFSILQPIDLETIEEEPDDYQSQHSRATRSLKNGVDGGNNGRAGIAGAILHGQTDTITTYSTQFSEGFDPNNIISANSTTSRQRNSNNVQNPFGHIRIKQKKFDDDYNARHGKPWTVAGDFNNMPTPADERNSKFSPFCCPSAIRWLVLLLSFTVLSSLFANLQLFNLTILYTQGEAKQRLLMPQELFGMANVMDSGASRPTINWADEPISSNLSANISTATTIPTRKLTKNEDQNKLVKEGKIMNSKDYKDYDYPKGEEREVQDDEEFEPEPEQQKMQSEMMGHKIRRLSQSLLFSVPGMAILVAHFPCYLLVRRFGARKLVFAALLISGIITGAFPFLMDFESPFPFILFARIFLGFCISPAFSFLGQMSHRWATVGEQHFFVLIGFMAIQFGPSMSWFLAIGLLRFDHFSHIQVFGIHSVISILLAFIWLIFYRDQPQKHQMVNGEELNYIVKKKPRSGRPLRLPTTLFCLLLRSTSAWACWISSFCYFFALLSLLIFYPIFSHKVLRQTVDHSLVTPFILMFLAHFLFHTVAAFSSSQPATWKMRLFNSGAFLLSAMFFLGIAVIFGNNELSAVRSLWLFWFCLLPLGATSLGFIKSTAITGGGPFTQYIVSHMQCAFGLAYALVPTLLFSSINEGSIIHWRLLFLGCALLLLLGMAIFVILGRGTPTSWAEQWADDARGDAPLLLIKFSPIHRSAAAPTTSQQ